MERKNVNVYFSNGDGCLIFGNYPEFTQRNRGLPNGTIRIVGSNPIIHL